MKREPVAVIGAGLAGAATAAALARRGQAVDLFHDPATTTASHPPLAVLRPHLAAQTDPLARLRDRGLRATHAWLGTLRRCGHDTGLHGRGLVLLAGDGRGRRRRDRLPARGPGPRRLDPDAVAAAAGVHVDEAAIFHPLGAWLAPGMLLEAFLASGGHRIRCTAGHVAALHWRRGWHLRGSAASYGPYARLVVAAGTGTRVLLPELASLIVPARGQATAVAATPASSSQRLPVSGEGYITPADHQGCHWVGASIQRGDVDATPRSMDDQANVERFMHCWPDAHQPAVIDRFVGIRATTPDRLPIVGRVRAGLWVSVGHGAHGLCTAPLAGLLLAAALAGKEAPLMRRVAVDRPALRRIHRKGKE